MKSTTAVMAALALAATMPVLAQSSKAPVRREERTIIIRNGNAPQILSNDSMLIIEQMNADDLPDIDSLRTELRMQNREARQLKIELRRINKDVQKQMRGIQRQIIINGDTAGLAAEMKAEMEHVRKSIEDANGNLLQVDSNIRHMTLPGVGEISMSLIPDSGMGNGTVRTVIVMNDSSVCHGALAKLGKFKCTSTVIVRTTIDSTQDHVMLNDPGENGDVRVEVITSDSLGMPLNADGTKPMIARERVMVMGNDSVRVIEGGNSRTLVRIGRDTATNGTRSRVTIVTTTKQQTPSGSDTLEGPTLDTRQSSEHPAASESLGYQLEANRPNPFSTQTVISFTLPKAGQTRLTVFNAEGGEVKVLKDENLPAGSYSVTFDGSDLPSGNYLYRLVSGGYSETKTMSLTK
ncbi:MAG: Por secretion system C-terminal sorting protein [Chlorobi bacterium]|nr:Por secretion system C-terminal sorting protein [Chlorobiota bacterium]